MLLIKLRGLPSYSRVRHQRPRANCCIPPRTCGCRSRAAGFHPDTVVIFRLWHRLRARVCFEQKRPNFVHQLLQSWDLPPRIDMP